MPPTVAAVVAAGSLRDRLQPTVPLGDGLAARPWRDADAPVVVAAFADPAIEFWHRRRCADEAEARTWIAGWTDDWEAETGARWAVTDGAGVVVGQVSLRGIMLGMGVAELSYWTLPQARGRGVAVTAALGLTRWAFEDVGLHRVRLAHGVANQASCRVATAAGFRLEGVQRGWLRHADGWHDGHLHARLATDTVSPEPRTVTSDRHA